MRKRTIWFYATVLSALLLLAGVTATMAAHPDITTLKADNTAAGPTDAYSPKQTCGGCHFNCATGAYSADTTTWCRTAAEKKNCAAAGNCPDYDSAATVNVSKVQGYGNSSGKVDFQNYTVTSPAHGVSTGKHSQHGRNEGWTAALRSIWGAPAFTSSPGMWGRY